MQTSYHRAITEQALSQYFLPPALEQVVIANLAQDHLLSGQIGHPEYHFDHNSFAKSWAYMENNRELILPALEAGDARAARRAFGRLTHGGQDLYAHSNYVALWLGRFKEGEWPLPEDLDPLDMEILQGPALRSGKIYLPLEPLSWIPVLQKIVMPLIPRDSHAWMNLDGPERGPLFAYALAAAVKRTRFEYQRSVQGLPGELMELFTK